MDGGVLCFAIPTDKRKNDRCKVGDKSNKVNYLPKITCWQEAVDGLNLVVWTDVIDFDELDASRSNPTKDPR